MIALALPLAALVLAAPPPGPRAEGTAFQVELVVPPTAAGQGGAARVTVTARPPYHVNRDYPTSFRPDAASTATFSASRVALGDGAIRSPCASDPGEACSISVPLPFTAPATGPAVVAGTVAFSLCNPDRCLIEKVALSATAAPASTPRR